MYSPIFSKSIPINKAYTNCPVRLLCCNFSFILTEGEMGKRQQRKEGNRIGTHFKWVKTRTRVTWRHDLSGTGLHLTKQILSLFHKCWICPQDTSSHGVSGSEIMRTPWAHVSVSALVQLRLKCKTSSALLLVLKLELFQIQRDFPFSSLSSLCRALSPTFTDQSCIFFSWWLLSQQSKLEMKKGGEKKRD